MCHRFVLQLAHSVKGQVEALAIQAIAVETPIPNQAAAERAEMPFSDAARTLLYRLRAWPRKFRGHFLQLITLSFPPLVFFNIVTGN